MLVTQLNFLWSLLYAAPSYGIIIVIIIAKLNIRTRLSYYSLLEFQSLARSTVLTLYHVDTQDFGQANLNKFGMHLFLKVTLTTQSNDLKYFRKCCGDSPHDM